LSGSETGGVLKETADFNELRQIVGIGMKRVNGRTVTLRGAIASRSSTRLLPGTGACGGANARGSPAARRQQKGGNKPSGGEHAGK